MKTKRILVTGASGLLGRPILKALNEVKYWKVKGTAFSRPAKNLIIIDLADLNNLPEFLESVKPEIIIHSAAERRPDISQRDPERTQRLNVDTTAKIAEWVAANDAFLVYISTDYVFDGTTPPYATDSPPNPINSYGKSKREGEIAVLSTCHEYVILRVPILYGDVESLDESAVITVVKSMLNAADGEPIKAENWAIRYPTLTDDVADVIKQILLFKEGHPTFKGIFHWSGDEAMTKYEMAKVLAQHLDFDENRIIPDNAPPQGTPRPKNCKLDISELTRIGIAKQTPFREAVSRILQDILKKKDNFQCRIL